MKKIKLLFIAAAMLMMASQVGSATVITPTMELTFTGNDIQFGVTAQNMKIDWDDGSKGEYDNLA
ncbi:MAG: hypothetical protein LBH30_06715 [Prevotellaceae bacterium]|nr:hypothetical protein [Prevotellaceae bacterium]